MLGNLGNNLGGMLSQVQNIQSSLKEIIVEVSTGEGAVTLSMNGSQQLLGIKIDPGAIKAEDIAKLEDMVAEGLRRVQQETRSRVQQEISKLTGLNLANLPSMFKG